MVRRPDALCVANGRQSKYIGVYRHSEQSALEATVKLVGTTVSPFVRRVAVSLNVLGLPYEAAAISASKQPEEVRKFNPLTRVPALMLDDGETLIESSAILDAIDQIVGPEHALLPISGQARRYAMKTTAIGLGCADKSVWAYYELTRRPEEKVHQPWLEHNEQQVVAGYAYLEEQLREHGVDALFRSQGRLNQAGITCAVAFRVTAHVRPKLAIRSAAPTLAAFSEECEALEAFRAAAIP
jgi:glutathione S-transferase